LIEVFLVIDKSIAVDICMFFSLFLFDVYCCEFVKENLPRKNFEIWGPQNQGFWGENSHEKCLGQKKSVV